MTRPPCFTCPDCGAVSHHPDDIAAGYCGACHDYTGHAAATTQAGPDDAPIVIYDGWATRCTACRTPLTPTDPPPGLDDDGDLDWYQHPEPVQRGHTRWIAIGRPR